MPNDDDPMQGVADDTRARIQAISDRIKELQDSGMSAGQAVTQVSSERAQSPMWARIKSAAGDIASDLAANPHKAAETGAAVLDLGGLAPWDLEKKVADSNFLMPDWAAKRQAGLQQETEDIANELRGGSGMSGVLGNAVGALMGEMGKQTYGAEGGLFSPFFAGADAPASLVKGAITGGQAHFENPLLDAATDPLNWMLLGELGAGGAKLLGRMGKITPEASLGAQSVLNRIRNIANMGVAGPVADLPVHAALGALGAGLSRVAPKFMAPKGAWRVLGEGEAAPPKSWVQVDPQTGQKMVWVAAPDAASSAPPDVQPQGPQPGNFSSQFARAPEPPPQNPGKAAPRSMPRSEFSEGYGDAKPMQVQAPEPPPTPKAEEYTPFTPPDQEPAKPRTGQSEPGTTPNEPAPSGASTPRVASYPWRASDYRSMTPEEYARSQNPLSTRSPEQEAIANQNVADAHASAQDEAADRFVQEADAAIARIKAAGQQAADRIAAQTAYHQASAPTPPPEPTPAERVQRAADAAAAAERDRRARAMAAGDTMFGPTKAGVRGPILPRPGEPRVMSTGPEASEFVRPEPGDTETAHYPGEPGVADFPTPQPDVSDIEERFAHHDRRASLYHDLMVKNFEEGDPENGEAWKAARDRERAKADELADTMRESGRQPPASQYQVERGEADAAERAKAYKAIAESGIAGDLTAPEAIAEGKERHYWNQPLEQLHAHTEALDAAIKAAETRPDTPEGVVARSFANTARKNWEAVAEKYGVAKKDQLLDVFAMPERAKPEPRRADFPATAEGKAAYSNAMKEWQKQAQLYSKKGKVRDMPSGWEAWQRSIKAKKRELELRRSVLDARENGIRVPERYDPRLVGLGPEEREAALSPVVPKESGEKGGNERRATARRMADQSRAKADAHTKKAIEADRLADSEEDPKTRQDLRDMAESHRYEAERAHSRAHYIEDAIGKQEPKPSAADEELSGKDYTRRAPEKFGPTAYDKAGLGVEPGRNEGAVRSNPRAAREAYEADDDLRESATMRGGEPTMQGKFRSESPWRQRMLEGEVPAEDPEITHGRILDFLGGKTEAGEPYGPHRPVDEMGQDEIDRALGGGSQQYTPDSRMARAREAERKGLAKWVDYGLSPQFKGLTGNPKVISRADYLEWRKGVAPEHGEVRDSITRQRNLSMSRSDNPLVTDDPMGSRRVLQIDEGPGRRSVMHIAKASGDKAIVTWERYENGARRPEASHARLIDNKESALAPMLRERLWGSKGGEGADISRRGVHYMDVVTDSHTTPGAGNLSDALRNAESLSRTGQSGKPISGRELRDARLVVRKKAGGKPIPQPEPDRVAQLKEAGKAVHKTAGSAEPDLRGAGAFSKPEDVREKIGWTKKAQDNLNKQADAGQTVARSVGAMEFAKDEILRLTGGNVPLNAMKDMDPDKLARMLEEGGATPDQARLLTRMAVGRESALTSATPVEAASIPASAPPPADLTSKNGGAKPGAAFSGGQVPIAMRVPSDEELEKVPARRVALFRSYDTPNRVVPRVDAVTRPTIDAYRREFVKVTNELESVLGFAPEGSDADRRIWLALDNRIGLDGKVTEKGAKAVFGPDHERAGEPMLHDEDPLNDQERRAVEKVRELFDGLADRMGLKEKGKYREDYVPYIRDAIKSLNDGPGRWIYQGLPDEIKAWFLKTRNDPALSEGMMSIRRALNYYVPTALKKLHFEPMLERMGKFDENGRLVGGLIQEVYGKEGRDAWRKNYATALVQNIVGAQGSSIADMVLHAELESLKSGVLAPFIGSIDPKTGTKIALGLTRQAARSYMGFNPASPVRNILTGQIATLMALSKPEKGSGLRGLSRVVTGPMIYMEGLGRYALDSLLSRMGQRPSLATQADVSRAMQGMLTDVGHASGLWGKLDSAAFKAYSWSEFWNRGIAFHAGLADYYHRNGSPRVPKTPSAEAIAYAQKVSDETQFVHSLGAKSPFLSGAKGQVATQFLNWQLNQLSYTTEHVADALHGILKGDASQLAPLIVGTLYTGVMSHVASRALGLDNSFMYNWLPGMSYAAGDRTGSENKGMNLGIGMGPVGEMFADLLAGNWGSALSTIGSFAIPYQKAIERGVRAKEIADSGTGYMSERMQETIPERALRWLDGKLGTNLATRAYGARRQGWHFAWPDQPLTTGEQLAMLSGFRLRRDQEIDRARVATNQMEEFRKEEFPRGLFTPASVRATQGELGEERRWGAAALPPLERIRLLGVAPEEPED